MAAEPRPGAVPFREAIDFFRAKLNVPTAAWTDLWQDQHAIGFMVAGAATADLVADLRAAVDEAISTGITQADFRQRFDEVVARHGWTYKGGPGWRSRVIFRTNLRTAYAAGKWQQAQSLKAERPFLRYSAVMDGDTRPLHRQWHGTILPVDHAWWLTHYPPNDWGCRCTVMSLSQRDLDRRGWKVSAPPPVAMRLVDVPGRGRIEVPEGIGAGFGYNVGVAAQRAQVARLAAAKLGSMPADLAAVVARAFPAEQRRALAEAFGAWAREIIGTGQADGSIFPLGALPPQVIDELARLAASGEIPALASAPVSGAVAIPADKLLRIVGKDIRAPGRSLALSDILRLPDLVAEPDLVLIDRNNGNLVLVLQPLDPEDARLGKVIIRLDFVVRRNGTKSVFNAVVSGGLVDEASLRNAGQFRLVSGTWA